MTTPQIISIILAAIALIANFFYAIFRNQLSSKGDKISKNSNLIKRQFISTFSFLLLFLYPVYAIIEAFAIDKFSKLFILKVGYYTLLIIFYLVSSLVGFVVKKVKRTIIEASDDFFNEQETEINTLKQYYQTQGITFSKIEEDIKRRKEVLLDERKAFKEIFERKSKKRLRILGMRIIVSVNPRIARLKELVNCRNSLEKQN